MAKENRRKVWLIRSIIFFALFILAEIVLRIAGQKPHVLIRWAYMKYPVVNDSVLYGDEMGISHYVSDGHYKPDAVINQQGFLGTFSYDSASINSIRKSQNKKVVMAIGDSYLDGCCSDSVANSFAGLVGKSKDYLFLNYGVAGADVVQYRLVSQKYVPEIRPDLVIVFFYFGNDVLTYDRTPKPYIPLCYVPIGGPWLNSEPPYRIAPPNYVLKDFNTAVKFYQSWYSLKGKERNPLLKFMGNSILFSKAYLGIEYKWKTYHNRKNLYEPPKEPTYSYAQMKQIEDVCRQFNSKLLIIGIPSPVDIAKKKDLKSTYHFCFNEIPWTFPSNLDKRDYDGGTIANHFNKKGHRKFAEYLDKILIEELKK